MRTRFLKQSPLTSPPMAPSSPHRHTFSEKLIDENIEAAELLIFKWDHNASTYCNISSLFNADNRHEAKEYLDSIKNLQSAMQYCVTDHSNADKLIRAQSLMQIAMRRLEREFYQILKSKRDSLDAESISSHSSVSVKSSALDLEEEMEDDEEPRLHNSALDDLKVIADCMIASGYAKECVKIYKLIRKSILDEGLYHHGIDYRLNFSQIQKMDWEVLEAKIKTWLYIAKLAVKSLFYGERILCDHVFSNSPYIKESCFSEITKDGALALFGFPEHVANCRKSPEKMFRILDLYETISDSWPEIDSIFSLDSTSIVRSQVLNSLGKLADAVRMMLTDFETAISKDSSRAPVPGGGVHPLTRYVMNYITFLTDYSGSLADIIADGPLSEPAPLPEYYLSSPDVTDNGTISTAISTRLAWIILVLLCKLDGKAELYKDVALSYLFLANNLHYTVNKVHTSNLKLLLGDEWIKNHEEKVRKYASNYERIGWNKVITSFPENLAEEIGVSEAADCFRKFNAAFEEVYMKQSAWIVPDSKLREEIKVSLAKKLVPVYCQFYDQYRAAVTREMRSDVIVRFTPDDLGNYLSDLLYGTGGPGSVSSSSDVSSFCSSWSGH